MEETQLQDRPSQYYSPTSGTPKNWRRALPLIVIVVIIAVIVFAGTRFLGSKKSGQEKAQTPTPTEFQIPTETPSPTVESATPGPTSTPTPKPTVNPVDKTTGLDRSKLSVSVENGSGEAGVAKKASDILKDLGYNVVSVGNAGNYDYTNVTVQVKSENSDYLPLLKKDLSASYTIGSTSSDLSATSSADAIVIVGK